MKELFASKLLIIDEDQLTRVRNDRNIPRKLKQIADFTAMGKRVLLRAQKEVLKRLKGTREDVHHDHDQEQEQDEVEIEDEDEDEDEGEHLVEVRVVLICIVLVQTSYVLQASALQLVCHPHVVGLIRRWKKRGARA